MINLPSENFNASHHADFSQDFQDIGDFAKKITVSFLATIGDLHRMYCMTDKQCGNIVRFIAAHFSNGYLTYERQPSEPDALIPDIEDVVIEKISHALEEMEAEKNTEREKFREYGRRGGRPRKDQPRKPGRKPKKASKKRKNPPFSEPSETPQKQDENQAQKPPVFQVANSCDSSIKIMKNEGISSCARIRDNNIIINTNIERIEDKEGEGGISCDFSRKEIVQGREWKRGSCCLQSDSSSSGGEFQWGYDVPSISFSAA